ncbi:MAG: FmdB family zinc ribbon protein [Actinomycetota bacterium]|nr:FmdB family zinc ribbon protein [Actinomycetota bacterium]
MPTYEYVCKECGENFEIFQSFSDKPLKKHANCGGPLQKVFHARGIVFKGSGFYATDSKASAASKTPSTSAANSEKNAKKSDSKKGTKTPSGSSSSSSKSG